MAKISTFIIGTIIFTLFIGVILIISGKMNENYPLSDYNSNDLNNYDRLTELANLSDSINSASDLEQNTGILDIVGFYITGAYNTLKVSKASLTTFDSMSNEALSQSDLGETSGLFRIAIGSIILIIIVVGIIISALLYNKV